LKLSKLYKDTEKIVENIESEVKKQQSNLDWQISDKDKFANDLNTVIKKITSFKQLNNSISSYITSTVDIIKNTDNNMADKLDVSMNKIPSDNTNADNSPKPNPAFNSNGSYGGNQGSPMNNYDEVVDIVHKYHPEYNKDQVEDYLEKLNSEGCGYVALTNTLFRQYAGREAEFEKKFGFPMYKENGELNHEALITDFYGATDNHNKSGWWIFSHDSVNSNEDISATQGSGTTEESRKYRWEMYLDNHDIDVNVDNDVKVTPANFNQVSKSGDIVVRINPCRLLDENGNVAANSSGGHAMTVTGVTDDGRYIVSSWGEQYYINPKDKYNYLDFQQVKYE